MSATLFAHERVIFGTSDEGASASFAPMCLILLLASIFFEMNIMSDLSYTLCNRMALVHTIAKVSIELIAIYFHFFEIFIILIGEMAFCKPEFIIIESNYFQNAFWMILKH
jgi:hypothetical protein